MKSARVAYAGAVHDATEQEDGRVRLDDGRVLFETDVVWLPPIEPGTIFALGLNYAARAKELAFQPPKEPLIFLKGPNTLIGHRGRTRRPAAVEYMHYECELAVVIGVRAQQVSRHRAYEYVGGYTVANDYAIRDFLENYYRPNLRVKSRDGCTPIGPWLVDAASVSDPMDLQLETRINGKLVQEGNTRGMIFDIPAIIEFLSGFMTLEAGDVILTGTPEGLTGVQEGDEVVTTIEGVGNLVNFVTNDSEFNIC